MTYGFKSRHSHHVGMDYAPFKIPSQMAGDFSYRFVIPPFRKKSRLLRLCPCKRGHDASALLPTFCGMREGSNSLLKNTGDFFVSPLHVGTSYARSGFYWIKNQSPAPLFLLFRKRPYSRLLFGCKRPHDGFSLLSAFCGSGFLCLTVYGCIRYLFPLESIYYLLVFYDRQSCSHSAKQFITNAPGMICKDGGG